MQILIQKVWGQSLISCISNKLQGAASAAVSRSHFEYRKTGNTPNILLTPNFD